MAEEKITLSNKIVDLLHSALLSFRVHGTMNVCRTVDGVSP